ncbi:Nardilysin, partial [Trachymyrmex septentrionalis]
AVCALCVGVGCFSDPEIQSIGNLFKHMVFMGSEKYSKENFKTYIKKRGGFVDILTDSEQTTFYFTIQEKYFFPALDRFAQGFIKPLMTEDTVSREREKINEYESIPCEEKELPAKTNLVNKYIRDNVTISSNHMDDNKLCEELHKFKDRYYSAHRMTLAIQAKLSLSTLEKFVTKCFVDVPSNKLSPDYVSSVSFGIPEIEQEITKTKSHMSHVMFKQEITWTISFSPDFYNSKPHEYIAWIIKHGGKGSLTSYLRKKMPSINLRDTVQCNSETFIRYDCIYTMFKLTVVLFSEEQEHLKEVLDAIFSFINLLKIDDPHKRTIYYDIYKIMEYNFRFINEENSVKYVINLCKGMHFYPPRDYITANKLISIEYNPEDIQKCLNYLKPETAIITILQEKPHPLDCNEVQSNVNWDEKKCICIEVPKEYFEHWESIEPLPNFHLPLKNVFIASDFSLLSISENSKDPVKIYNDHISEIWYCPDIKFCLPKCYINFQFVSSLGVQSPKNAVIMEIYCRALKLLLFEELYPAKIAGFEYYIYTDNKGIIIEINGFTEKLPRLLITIAKYMANYPTLVTKSLFESCKEQLDKGYYSKAFMNPHKLIVDVKLSILKFVHYTSVDMHTALSNVNFEEFQRFVELFTNHLYIQCFVQGNITRDDAFVIIRECIEILNCGPLLTSTVQQMRVMQLPLGISYCKLKNIDKMDTTSVMTNYYQVGISSIELSVLIDLMMEIMFEKLQNWELDEQLPFKIVLSDLDDINGILGFSITTCTEANKCTTEYMNGEIEIFLQVFNEILRNLEDKELDCFKKRLILDKKNEYADDNVKKVVDRKWNEILNGEYIFDRYEKEMLAIKNITIDDLKKCFTKHIENGSNFRKLSIHIVENDPEKIAVEKENIENPEAEHFTLEYIKDDCHIVDVEDNKKYLYAYPFKLNRNPN